MQQSSEAKLPQQDSNHGMGHRAPLIIDLITNSISFKLKP